MKEIAILLPYKENFTENNAGAASIWVKDYLNKSKLKDKTIVYGNLDQKQKPLLKNFKNLTLNDSFIKKNITYTEKLYQEYLKNKFKIIEIFIFCIKKKIILFFQICSNKFKIF